MLNESTDRTWWEVLRALPLPGAVLDANYRFLLLNQASALDPLLARGRVGGTDLGCCEAEPAALAWASDRHRQYERSLRTQQPLCFEEAGPAAGGDGRPVVWLCLPVRAAEQTYLLVLGLGADGVRPDTSASEAWLALLHRIHRELRAPLAALVGLAGTLVHELSGEQHARAVLIDQSGQRLLRHLSRLIGEAEKTPGNLTVLTKG